jgi:hypothetical protein
MTEQAYQNREIKAMFERLDEKLDNHSKVHGLILDQTTATNGKVAEIQKWKERVMGGFYVASSLGVTIILPLLIWAIVEVNDIENKIVKSLNNYQIEIIQP